MISQKIIPRKQNVVDHEAPVINHLRLESKQFPHKLLLERLRYEQNAVGYSDGKMIHILKLSSIIYIQARSNYSLIFMLDGTKYMSAKTLKYWQQKINHSFFIRPHQSYLINKKFVSSINLKSSSLQLNTSTIPISRRYKADVVAIFKDKSC